jgi:2-oxoisovalerate dehydrogenase E1 component
VSGSILDDVRTTGTPRALVIATSRFGPHSKGDDTRSTEAIEDMRLHTDPLAIHGSRLSEDQRVSIDASVESEVAEAFETALADPDAGMERMSA